MLLDDCQYGYIYFHEGRSSWFRVIPIQENSGRHLQHFHQNGLVLTKSYAVEVAKGLSKEKCIQIGPQFSKIGDKLAEEEAWKKN